MEEEVRVAGRVLDLRVSDGGRMVSTGEREVGLVERDVGGAGGG